MNHSSNNHPPTQPRNGNSRKVSQRGLLSIVMLLVSMGALGISLVGAIKLISDVFADKLTPESLGGIVPKVIVVGLAYAVGWLTAMVAIRVYGNLIMPMLINWFTWGCLVGVCILQVLVLQRLYDQGYDLLHYWAYLSIVGVGLGAMVGLHLIIEDHDLRPFSIPLLIISLIQLGMIVLRYVFDTNGLKPDFLWKDLLFFFSMSAVSIAMLAHIGLLEPLRKQLTNYFDRNSTSIRSND